MNFIEAMMSPHYNKSEEIEAFIEYECYDISSLSHDDFARVLHLFVLHHEILDKETLLLGDTFVDTPHTIHHLVENRPRSMSYDFVALNLNRIFIDVLSCTRLDATVILMNMPYLFQALNSSSSELKFLQLHVAYTNGPMAAVACEGQFKMFRTFMYEQYADLGLTVGETEEDDDDDDEDEEDINGDPEVQDLPDDGTHMDNNNGNEGTRFSSLSSIVDVSNYTFNGSDSDAFTIPLNLAYLPDILQKNALHMAAKSSCLYLFQEMAMVEGASAFSLRDTGGNLILHSVIGRTGLSLNHFSNILNENIQHFSHTNSPGEIDRDDHCSRFRGLLTKNNAGMTPIDLVLQLVWYNNHHQQHEETQFEVYEACMKCLNLVNEKFNDIFHHVIPSPYYYPPALESIWMSNATVKEQSTGRLPLHVGALCGLGWSTALYDIFNGYPEAMVEKDPITGLIPALLVATSEGKEKGSPDLGTIYECIRVNPDLFDIYSPS